MITFSSCEWKSNKHFLKLWVMKIEHFFLMAGLGEVAHFDVDQLSDLLRKNPIRPERQRRKVRRWEDSKIYPSKLYEGPTIPLLGQGLVLTKRPGMDAPPCEERGAMTGQNKGKPW